MLGGDSSMGFKGKILTVLIVYFAGFATAIYALAPANPRQVTPHESKKPVSFPQSFTKSDQFALAFNSGMRKCISASKQAALKTGIAVKAKPNALDSKK
jgi:hypothetical protein